MVSPQEFVCYSPGFLLSFFFFGLKTLKKKKLSVDKGGILLTLPEKKFWGRFDMDRAGAGYLLFCGTGRGDVDKVGAGYLPFCST